MLETLFKRDIAPWHDRQARTQDGRGGDGRPARRHRQRALHHARGRARDPGARTHRRARRGGPWTAERGTLRSSAIGATTRDATGDRATTATDAAPDGGRALRARAAAPRDRRDRRGDEDRAVAPARRVRRAELGRELLRLARGRRRRRHHHRPARRGRCGHRAEGEQSRGHRRRRVHRPRRRPRAAGRADARLLLRAATSPAGCRASTAPARASACGSSPWRSRSCSPLLALVAGDEYNVLEQLGLPALPVGESGRWPRAAGSPYSAIAGGTLFASLVGGKAGERYHRRVDRAGFG